jgi:hypothetical protein
VTYDLMRAGTIMGMTVKVRIDRIIAMYDAPSRTTLFFFPYRFCVLQFMVQYSALSNTFPSHLVLAASLVNKPCRWLGRRAPPGSPRRRCWTSARGSRHSPAPVKRPWWSRPRRPSRAPTSCMRTRG